jgi:hypothetical protein
MKRITYDLQIPHDDHLVTVEQIESSYTWQTTESSNDIQAAPIMMQDVHGTEIPAFSELASLSLVSLG